MKIGISDVIERARGALGLRRAAADARPGVPVPDASQLPPGAQGFLTYRNPQLVQLARDYAKVALPVTNASQWSESYQRSAASLPFFRGDNEYIWQHRGYASMDVAEQKHRETAAYVRAMDSRGLLGLLKEDGMFGAYTVRLDDGTVVSRDLLDSIVELYFLDRHLGLFDQQGLRVLDIGAGYGRLAHRAVVACPGIEKYFCTDAVPISTFISDYYLRFRGIADRAVTVPLPQIETVLATGGTSLALNIHSFSECRLVAVDCWVGLLAKHRVAHLMIVPNDGPFFRCREPDGSAPDYRPVLDRLGYELVASRPQYLDEGVQKNGLHPSWHYLFKLRGC